MDIAAARLRIDPIELRRRNFVTPAEMPYEVGGASLNQRTVYDCGDYASALDKALDALDHAGARGLQAEARRQGRYVGIGIAALVEKAGLPRDRLLDDDALAVAVQADGGTAESFYYGHNYRASDVARLFALADRDGVRLTAEEERLRGLARELGWLHPGATGALVSLPQAGVEAWLDMRARATMLRHELSHGEFFTSPAYAAHAWRFWREVLTEEERTRLRATLAHASYDPSIEEVMANEAQAFLFHTPDERFFSPASVGFTADRMAALHEYFVTGMPPGWLRDALAR
jgi:hypothetical protein